MSNNASTAPANAVRGGQRMQRKQLNILENHSEKVDVGQKSIDMNQS